jgi:hypothetical protein
MALDWSSMENETTLEDIIQESLAATDPEPDNPNPEDQEDTEVEDDGDASILDLIGDDDEDDESEESEEDEGGEPDPRLDEMFEVKVDGEVVEVSLKEALAGYQRQADYTRKAQALAAEKQQLEEVIGSVSDTLATMQTLDVAWEENPIQVLTHFLSNTENPTFSMALLIKEAASANMLDQEFLDMFGITGEVRKAWKEESEVSSLKRKVSQSEQQEMTRQQEAAYEAEVQRAMAEYAREVDSIVAAEGLKLTRAQRDAFQTRLAQYAYENELTNLSAAYKALKYEETVRKREVAKRTQERAKQKKAASVVGRSGSGAPGQPVADNTDLESLIRASMKEQGLA